MAINATLPHWLQEANTGWLRTAERTGAHAISQGFDAGQKLVQNQQDNLLRLRQLMLQREQLDAENKLRWQKLSEAEAETRDLALLQQYAQDPDSGIPQFESQNSYSKLSAIDLARSRSDLGRQLSFDRADLNKRLSKVSAADRAAILEAKQKGLGEGEVYSLLNQAEARQREKLAAEKVYAPSDVRKLLDESVAAEMNGDTETADLLRQRARTLSRGGRESSIQNLKLSAVDRFRLQETRSRIATLDRSLGGKFGLVAGEDELNKLRQERSELLQQQTGILQRYETPSAQSPGMSASGVPFSDLSGEHTFRVPVDHPGGPLKLENPADIEAVIEEGNRAIREGRDPAIIRQKMREMGIQLPE